MSILGWKLKKPAPDAASMPEPAPVPASISQSTTASITTSTPARKLRAVYPIYDSARVIIALSETPRPGIPLRDEVVHATALLEYLGMIKGIAGEWITSPQLQAYYRGFCLGIEHTPCKWNPLAREIRKLTTGGRKHYHRVDGKPRPIYFIPDLRADAPDASSR